MNLFSKPKTPKATPAPPTIDEAQQRVGEQARARRMRGRAATMLSQGGQAPTGQATVTGN